MPGARCSEALPSTTCRPTLPTTGTSTSAFSVSGELLNTSRLSSRPDESSKKMSGAVTSLRSKPMPKSRSARASTVSEPPVSNSRPSVLAMAASVGSSSARLMDNGTSVS